MRHHYASGCIIFKTWGEPFSCLARNHASSKGDFAIIIGSGSARCAFYGKPLGQVSPETVGDAARTVSWEC
jgi:hypothetical protein